ncbi:MAG: hypothetical protein BWY07_02745 [Candidatus Hydrogenedentes bacterium ADurb.Bin170]|nr:MAG: hypothetical protein BWY07_02745 [Candidatus Hydrogenedentes bacterium ADurb.Bin170]
MPVRLLHPRIHQHMKAGGLDPLFVHLIFFNAKPLEIHRGDGMLNQRIICSGIQQRSHGHVAADTAKTIKI